MIIMMELCPVKDKLNYETVHNAAVFCEQPVKETYAKHPPKLIRTSL